MKGRTNKASLEKSLKKKKDVQDTQKLINEANKTVNKSVEKVKQ